MPGRGAAVSRPRLAGSVGARPSPPLPPGTGPLWTAASQLSREGAAAAGGPGGESALAAEMNGRAAAGAAGAAGCAARSALSDRDHIDASSLGFHQDALPAPLAATRPGAAISPRTATTPGA